ncbi:MAG TPA: hypothetical protein EYG76_02510 [Methanothermococcus okinawensis]|uniref:Uncharacterized protein n=1 Tax=Methanothermococcus okinawensis TaxID=155863 RepID=A0A832YT60_9EURY|nr:hypothetical protein [Methanothermococcus okinawensis]
MKLDKIKFVEDKVILNSMKDVFESEIAELERELKELYEKYNIKSSEEIKLIESKEDEESNKDFDRIMEIEHQLKDLKKFLREVNLKII